MIQIILYDYINEYAEWEMKEQEVARYGYITHVAVEVAEKSFLLG